MAAPIRFLSGRQQQQKIGIEGSTEDQKVLEVVGQVGIGTTIFEPSKQLDVRGDVTVSGELTVGDTTFGVDFSTRNLSVSGLSTFTGAIDANGDLDVDGHTELDHVNVSGASTFTGAADFNGDLDVDGHTELDNLNVSGVSTFTSDINVSSDINVTGDLRITGFASVTQGLYYDSNDYDGPNGIAYFDNTGKLIGAASTGNAVPETYFILTTNNVGIPTWTSTIDGGSF